MTPILNANGDIVFDESEGYGYAPPVCFRYSTKDKQVPLKCVVGFDPRWRPEAPFLALGVGQPAHIGWAIEGRQILPHILYPAE